MALVWAVESKTCLKRLPYNGARACPARARKHSFATQTSAPSNALIATSITTTRRMSSFQVRDASARRSGSESTKASLLKRGGRLTLLSRWDAGKHTGRSIFSER